MVERGAVVRSIVRRRSKEMHLRRFATMMNHYNYLTGSYDELPLNYDINKREDPDQSCKKLYDDVVNSFFGEDKDVKNLEQQYGNKPPFYTVQIQKNGETYLFSSDYIGPSVYWARELGISDRGIIKFLNICRTLGGHIIWPRGGERPKGVFTPNQAKSGCSGVYDRIDWTLQLLKIFYEIEKYREDKKEYLKRANALLPKEFRNKSNFNDKFDRLYNSFDFYKKHFELFGDFEGFCERFKLVGSFVDNDHNIIWMTDSFPILPLRYEEYIEKLSTAVQARNFELIQIVKLTEMPEIKEKAAKWFHEKWGVPLEAYLESMEAALNGDPIQEWYLCLNGDKIIAGAGVIENDFHDRKDLTPNVCAVYTEEQYRGKGIAGKLLDFIVVDNKEKGNFPIYLLTDHTGFYERYGWEFLCMAQGDGESDMSRIYIHR